MFTLPALIEEDVQQIQSALGELLNRSEALTAMIVDKGGFVVAAAGATDSYDLTTLGALAAASFTATQAIASLINEPNFSSVYQQGELMSLLVTSVGDQCLLVVVFKAQISVGIVKYYSKRAVPLVVNQLQVAQDRTPGEGLDLSMLNMADPSSLFRKKEP